MEHQIRLAAQDDYPDIMEIWESTVKATHDFYQKKILTILKKSYQEIIYQILRFI